MRDRLIELLKDSPALDTTYSTDEEYGKAADYLLANGVIVPKVKVGEYVYRICGETAPKPWVYHWEIVEIMVYQDEIVYRDDSDIIIEDKHFGKTIFLTREEAENALAERSRQ